MVITNLLSFKPARSTNVRGQKSSLTHHSATATFAHRTLRAEDSLVSHIDADLALRRRIRERLEAKKCFIVH